MNYNEYMANIKAYKNGTLMQAAPTDALSDWHEKYFDTAVSALSKKMVADHVEHSEEADKFGRDFVSLVAILEEDGVSKQDIGKELEAVSKAAQSQADAAIKKIDSIQHSTDTLEGYKAAIKAYKENHLEHGEWKKHKYIRIENGRYIYPEDLKKTSVDNRTVQGKIKDAVGKLNSALNRKEEKSSSDNRTVQGKLKDAVAPFKEAGQKIVEAIQERKENKETQINKVDTEISKYVSKDSDAYKTLMDAANKIMDEDSGTTLSVSYDKDNNTLSLKNDDAYYNPDKNRQSKSSTTGVTVSLDEKKKSQLIHSDDPRAAFYAAVDEYKSKKGLDQRVPL